jgi:hypothetical protein
VAAPPIMAGAPKVIVVTVPGEVFKIETSGTEYCGDFAFSKFNAKNNVDLWIRLDDDEQITVSFTSEFAEGTAFPMSSSFYLTKPTSASFVAGALFEDFSYLTIQGTATLDKLGNVTKLSGTFIQSRVISEDCFSAGKFTSVKSRDDLRPCGLDRRISGW